MNPRWVSIVIATLCSGPSMGQVEMTDSSVGPTPLGLFETRTEPVAEGRSTMGRSAVAFDAETDEYALEWAGAGKCASADDALAIYRRVHGDFIVRARAEFEGDQSLPTRKLGWMVRASLEPGSTAVQLAVDGYGRATLTRGPEGAGGGMAMARRSTAESPDVIQLARQGEKLSIATARFGEPFLRQELVAADLDEEVYVGLFACSDGRQPLSGRASFRDVRIVKPAPADLVPYRDYLGSRLEILDVETGHRRIVHTTADSLQAPNWTADGRALIFNRNGLLYRFDLESSDVGVIDTGFADRNNNDHVLSFDGTMLGISHHAAEHDGQSIIYTLPLSGGTPRQVTPIAPSYLHGWSPDGRFLIYTGGRDGEYDIYRIGVEGGEEIRLTASPGLDDGSEYSPDGELIYFNSVRSGSMEIWRMRPDGSDPEPLTDDELNNWFPHVSPDGRWIVFLSYGPEVDPADHPFYRQVYLRRMPVAGGEPSVIAYLYGGQGTINVPSWAPDSRRLAFVSNSGEL